MIIANVVAVGGLITSTTLTLTLLLLPPMYEWVEMRRERRQSAADAAAAGLQVPAE